VQKYRVEITATAEADLREIHQYIVSDNKTAADKFDIVNDNRY